MLDGMADNARQLADRPVLYYPYVEPKSGEARDVVPGLGPAGLPLRDRRLPRPAAVSADR